MAAFDPTRSPLGDERHRPVACFVCRSSTWNWLGYCNEHLSEAPLQPCVVCQHRSSPAGQPCGTCSAFDNGGGS